MYIGDVCVSMSPEFCACFQEMVERDVPGLGIHEKLFSQDGRVVDLSDNSIEKRGVSIVHIYMYII